MRPDEVIDGKFRVHELLASGAFGSVYSAEQIKLQRQVAVKVLHPTTQLNQDARDRFLRECKLLSAIDHPSIVRVFAYGLINDAEPYIAMELVEGETLETAIARGGALEWNRVADMATKICEALEYAHKIGIVHRDLTPRNIMLVKDGTTESIKLLDFGLATTLPENQMSLQTITRTGAIIGTSLYMSPEGVLGSGVDQRSDIYSLGCVLYECLSGRPPFTGENVFEILQKQYVAMPPSMNDGASTPAVPEMFERIVFKAIEKDPEKRFQSCTEFASVLSLLKQGKIDQLERLLPKVEHAKTGARIDSRVLICAAAVLIVAAVACLKFLPMGGPATSDKSATAVATLSPAEQKRAEDVQRSFGMLKQAREEKSRGNFSRADQLARQSLNAIVTDYPPRIINKQTLADDLSILRQITEIYAGNKERVPPMNVDDAFPGTIYPRNIWVMTQNDLNEILRLQKEIAAIYSDSTRTAWAIWYRVHMHCLNKGNPEDTTAYCADIDKLIPKAAQSDPYTAYYIALSRAESAQALGKRDEAIGFANRAREAWDKMPFTRDDTAFEFLSNVFYVQQMLNDKKGSAVTFEKLKALAENNEFEEDTIRSCRGKTSDPAYLSMLDEYLDKSKHRGNEH